MKKKILLTLITVFVSLFAVGKIGVSAAAIYGSLIYEVEYDKIEIVGYLDGIVDATIPETINGFPVTSISDSAFFGCNTLMSVTIPESIEVIPYQAFACCEKLSNVNLPEIMKGIGSEAFCGCNKLSSIKIPNGVTDIWFGTFLNCGELTSIIIPNSVTFIEYHAFMESNLKTIYYSGNEEEWNNIIIDWGNDSLLNAEIIYNYNPSDEPEKITSASAEIISASSTPTSLKFISTVAIEGEPEIATFGTTFIPLWLFETGSSDVATVQYDNSKYDIQNGQTFGATLGGIPESAKDMVIVGKSFIKDADGNYTWSAAKSASVNNPTLNSVE